MDTYDILNAAYEVHSILGPGLLEEVYKKAFVHELQLRGYDVKTEFPVSLDYKGAIIGTDLRADIIINDEIIIELKAVTEIHAVFYYQLRTYLRFLHKDFGYIINFNEVSLKDGIRRVENEYDKKL